MRLRLWRRELALASPISAAQQLHRTRTHLFLELRSGGVSGLGELSPQPQGLNGDPGLDDILDELVTFNLPQLVDIRQREGALPQWARVTHLTGSRPASRFAAALVEMAVLDWQLRSEGRRIEDLWPARLATPEQVTVSMLDDNPWVSSVAAAQLRAKVSPAAASSRRWEELAARDRPVLLDFNCSAPDGDTVIEVLREARRHVAVAAMEQPFAAGNVVEHARLAERLDVALSLDEGVRQRRDIDQIARYRAAHWLCVKPARVGGFAQARTLIELAAYRGLEVYLGGFFESPLARGANRALAQHLITRPSDIAASPVDVEGLLEATPSGLGFVVGAELEKAPPLVSLRS